jgi:hypothetical protein
MKNKIQTKIIFLTVFILVLAIIGGVYYYKNTSSTNNSKAQTPPPPGTTVKYEDGKVSKKTLNEDYKNNLFPILKIPVEGTTFEVSENDRNKDGVVNYVITLKKDSTNLNITFYSDNGGRNAGATCLTKQDVLPLANNWFREKLKTQDGNLIGYNYVNKPNYILPNSDSFNNIYNQYKAIKESNKLPFLEKIQVDMCDFVQRVTETTTSVTQKNGQNKVFTRFMTDKVLPDADQKLIDDIVSKTKI